MKQRRQRTVSILLVIFFVLLAGLTIFSNTFQTALLPKVTTEMPQKKTLSRTIKGDGVIMAKEKEEISSENGGKIAVVHMKENDFVKEGQLLITFDEANRDQLRQQLREAELQLKKQLLNRELLQEQFVAAQHEGDETAIHTAKRNLRLDELDIELAELRLSQMRKDLERNQRVTAPFDGIVTELAVKEGTTVISGQAIMKLINQKAGFEVSVELDETEAVLLNHGSQLPVIVKTKEGKSLQAEGIIEVIKSADPKGSSGLESASRKTVIIQLHSDDIHEEDQASILHTVPAKEQGLVLRKQLLKKDGKGSYVFVIREVKSSLGNKYIAEKAYVVIGEEIDDEVIVLRGLSENDRIISESSEPIQENNRVRLF